MAAWGLGSPWGLGFPWGAPATGADWGCDLAQSGILSQSQGGTFSDWMCAFGEEIGSMLDVIVDVQNGYSIDYAVGAQLDVLGSILGLPRSGYGDDRYRTFLLIQRDLLLGAATSDGNWTGTGENIISICRRFIGPASGDPIVAITTPPYGFLLSVPDIDTILEFEILASFLRRAVYMAVLGQIIIVLPGDNVYCYVVAADTPGAGIYSYADNDPPDVAGGALYAGLVLIGDP